MRPDPMEKLICDQTKPFKLSHIMEKEKVPAKGLIYAQHFSSKGRIENRIAKFMDKKSKDCKNSYCSHYKNRKTKIRFFRRFETSGSSLKSKSHPQRSDRSAHNFPIHKRRLHIQKGEQ